MGWWLSWEGCWGFQEQPSTLLIDFATNPVNPSLSLKLMPFLSFWCKTSCVKFECFLTGVVDEGGWRGRWYGASSPQTQPQRRSPRKVSKDERRALLLSYVNMYVWFCYLFVIWFCHHQPIKTITWCWVWLILHTQVQSRTWRKVPVCHWCYQKCGWWFLHY